MNWLDIYLITVFSLTVIIMGMELYMRWVIRQKTKEIVDMILKTKGRSHLTFLLDLLTPKDIQDLRKVLKNELKRNKEFKNFLKQ